ncbi:TonB-dependent receptor [Ramlibacter sp.]|uniref:TonB-dependent receptor n=1 Tax=Ramlibacter sp. TaxID=1917967 RepID=UPI0032C21295
MLVSGSSVAQTQLAPVTVTATRTEASPFDVPAAVDVIDGARLRGAARPEVQLSESLAVVPGVTARDRQNYAQDLQLSIRGFGARSTFGVRGVRLYVDGIPATMPDGQGQTSHIDLGSAERIELLRGPFSALYGNSSGGVLQVFTEAGEGAPQVTGSMAAGSDGMLRPAVRALGKAGGIGFNLSSSHFQTDGSRDHSAAERELANARLDWNHWTLVANSVNVRADDPLGLTRAQFDAAPRSVDPSALAFDTRKTVRQSQLGLVHEHAIDAQQTLRLMLYGGERATKQFQSIPTATQANPLHPGGVIDLARTYAGADLRWTAKLTSLELVGGVSYDTLQEHRRGWLNFIGTTLGVQGALRRDEDNTATNLDPYLQAVWRPAPRWTLTAGARRSNVRIRSGDHYIAGTNGDDSGSLRFASTLPVAAAMFAITPQLHAYAAYGRGFETPTLNELAYRPDGLPGMNLGLKPSRSTNVEAGLKGRSSADAKMRLEWSAALFQTRTQDEIVTQTNSGGRSTFRNAGDTERRGLELSASARTDRGWSLQLARSWLDAHYADAFATCAATPCATPTLVIPAGNRIPGTARAFTAAELSWQPPEGWRAGVELRHSARVYVNDANTDAAGAWTTVALHTGYKWALPQWKIEAAARVDNLFDRRYAGSVIVNEGNARFFEPAPGRQFTVKLVATRPL